MFGTAYKDYTDERRSKILSETGKFLETDEEVIHYGTEEKKIEKIVFTKPNDTFYSFVDMVFAKIDRLANKLPSHKKGRAAYNLYEIVKDLENSEKKKQVCECLLKLFIEASYLREAIHLAKSMLGRDISKVELDLMFQRSVEKGCPYSCYEIAKELKKKISKFEYEIIFKNAVSKGCFDNAERAADFLEREMSEEELDKILDNSIRNGDIESASAVARKFKMKLSDSALSKIVYALLNKDEMSVLSISETINTARGVVLKISDVQKQKKLELECLEMFVKKGYFEEVYSIVTSEDCSFIGLLNDLPSENI